MFTPLPVSLPPNRARVVSLSGAGLRRDVRPGRQQIRLIAELIEHQA
jgi:hypothetical protein